MSTRTRVSRVIIAITSLVALLLGVLAAAVVIGNDFDYTSRPLVIPTETGSLHAILTTPINPSGPVPVVVFLHGDGPVTATNSGLYNPIFEAFAAAGYASLSWSKPGVEGSTGNWLNQTQQDRADEAGMAIDYLKKVPEVDASRIGIWATSQGGWPAPLLATQRDDVVFVATTSPAINWLDQGRFNLLAELEHTKASGQRTAHALDESNRVRELLAREGSYSAYLESLPDDLEPMTEDRWTFALKNFRTDATASLTELGSTHVPVLLMLAANDRNVDISETERVYRELLGDQLSVRIFADANHSMARSSVEDSPVQGLFTVTFAPRSIFAPGYLEALTSFAKRTLDRAA